MRLIVVGSSSNGNAYALQNDSEILIIENGMSYKEVVKATWYQPSKILACLITHEHG